jgi:hypothetical protein
VENLKEEITGPVWIFNFMELHTFHKWKLPIQERNHGINRLLTLELISLTNTGEM